MSKRFIKALQDSADPFLFVASTEAEDRYGDVIEQEGWNLADFRKNPIALWMHDHKSPIGTVDSLEVLRG